MSWVIHDAKTIFFHNPRTAGTSMVRSLRSRRNAVPYSADPDVLDWRKDHGVDVPPEMEDWRRVAFVRDPFSRELSLYFWNRRFDRHEIHRRARELSFRDFMRWRIDYPVPEDLRPFFGTQSRYLLGTEATCYRFERLPHEFENLFGVPLLCVPDTVSPHYRLSDHYDSETEELVRCYAGADFLNYGYSTVLGKVTE